MKQLSWVMGGIIVIALIAVSTFFVLDQFGPNNRTASNSSGEQTQDNNSALDNSSANANVDGGAPLGQVRGTVTDIQGDFIIVDLPDTASQPAISGLKVEYTGDTLFTRIDTTSPPVPGSDQVLDEEPLNVEELSVGDQVKIFSSEEVNVDSTTIHATQISVLR